MSSESLTLSTSPDDPEMMQELIDDYLVGYRNGDITMAQFTDFISFSRHDYDSNRPEGDYTYFLRKEIMFERVLVQQSQTSLLVKKLHRHYKDTLLTTEDGYHHLSYQDKLFTNDVWRVGLAINHFSAKRKPKREIIIGDVLAFHPKQNNLVIVFEEKGLFHELLIGEERGVIKWQGFDAFGKPINAKNCLLTNLLDKI